MKESLYLQMKMNMDLNKLDNQSINKNLNNRKNILRPLSLHHRRFRHLWYSFIILLTLLAYSYFPYFFFDIINSNFLERMGFSLGGRTLSSFLRKMGCPGSLALVILSLLGVFFGSESALINWMNSSGSASGSASESWQKYLNLSEENAASEPSTSHTPPNPEPEAPSISFLRERIKNVIRSCQRIRKKKS